ncbi:unnamed protein product [Aureobasidium uvarum]|uniref:Uncharacterized protein n=1 Tax=Aureobasidium uvarum TaxID=2773716 RepID=A0A9N8KGH1_9PEZI|nr:unnamed protein product [Aureobasidium uvarum]
MNPRAPHYKFQSASNSNGKDLESIYGSLRNNFVPASVSPPTMSGTYGDLAPALSDNTRELSTHSHSLRSDDERLLERARNEQLEQNQLAMHTKLLRLTDQVSELMSQRAALEKEKAEGDQTINDLRRDVTQLKALVGQHHNKLEVCKHAQALEQRFKEMTGKFEPRFQHYMTRIDKVEGLVRVAGSQIKQHAAQLGDGEDRIDQFEQASGGSTATIPQLKLSIEKLEKTQKSHKSYLQKIGETLVAHQTHMDTMTNTMNELRCKLESLSTINAGLRSNENSGPKTSLFKMDPTTDAIFKLQSKIDCLAEDVHYGSRNAESSTGNRSSSAVDVEDLVKQLGKIRNKTSTIEKDLKDQAKMRDLMDDILQAHRMTLETMFYQLTKEFHEECQPEDIVYGKQGKYDLDEKRIFMLRQRVLERLSIEDKVQLEFQRLKESQQMYS